MNSSNLLGVLLKIANLMTLTMISLGALKISSGLRSIDEFFIMCVGGSLFLIASVLAIKFYSGRTLKELLYTNSMKFYVLRAVISIIGMVSWLEALKFIGPNEATLLGYITPFSTILLAALFKAENISFKALGFSLACFLLIFSVLNPGSVSMYGFSCALMCAVAWSMYDIICKKQGPSEHYIVQALYTFAIATLLSLFFVESAIWSAPFDKIVSLSFIGVLRAVNIIFLFSAFRFAKINYLMPLSYLRFVFMAVGNLLIFQKSPTPKILLANFLLIALNVMFFYTKNREKLQENA